MLKLYLQEVDTLQTEIERTRIFEQLFTHLLVPKAEVTGRPLRRVFLEKSLPLRPSVLAFEYLGEISFFDLPKERLTLASLQRPFRMLEALNTLLKQSGEENLIYIRDCAEAELPTEICPITLSRGVASTMQAFIGPSLYAAVVKALPSLAPFKNKIEGPRVWVRMLLPTMISSDRRLRNLPLPIELHVLGLSRKRGYIMENKDSMQVVIDSGFEPEPLEPETDEQVPIAVQLGQFHLPLDQFLTLREGQTLHFSLPEDAEVALTIGDTVWASARIQKLDAGYKLKINQIFDVEGGNFCRDLAITNSEQLR